MKRILLILGLVLLLSLLTGCGCKHEWQDGSCTEPKSCRLCGQREGTALGHSWQDASCDTAKTCALCGQTEGEPLEHSWADATCSAPKTCTLCGLTQDIALEHDWNDATCIAPKSCSVCQTTEGDPLGHSWQDATCEKPKTCSVCHATDGKALGHKWDKTSCTQPQKCLTCGTQGAAAPGHRWADATCEEPMHCTACDATQGSPLGHSWQDATPDAPKTCTLCQATEGHPIYIDDRFVEADCAFLFGSWTYEKVYTYEELGIPGFEGEYSEYITYDFQQYGQLTVFTETANPKAFKDLLAAQIASEIYVAQAELGRDAAAAEEFWVRTYGVTIQQFTMQIVEDTTSDDDFNLIDENVYYVADGKLYIAPYWEDSFSVMSYQLEDDRLTVTNDVTGEIIVFTKVS